jgi:hypothetical protein
MKKFTRVRCPVCGMLPTLKNLDEAKERPAEIRIIVQRIYGKKKADKSEGEFKKKGRGSAPGWIEYEDVTDSMPEIVKK